MDFETEGNKRIKIHQELSPPEQQQNQNVSDDGDDDHNDDDRKPISPEVTTTSPEETKSTELSVGKLKSDDDTSSMEDNEQGGTSKASTTTPLCQDAAATTTAASSSPNKRWRSHQMVEDYVDCVGKIMYPSTKLRPYGYDTFNREYPLERISVLGYLKSPLRRPSIIETWSPYEIAVFEGALLHHGKEFHLVSKAIGTKSTKEVVDFFYVWKKTAHYKKWKDEFISDEDLLDMQEDQQNGY